LRPAALAACRTRSVLPPLREPDEELFGAEACFDSGMSGIHFSGRTVDTARGTIAFLRQMQVW
jgi:hypothetical protein